MTPWSLSEKNVFSDKCFSSTLQLSERCHRYLREINLRNYYYTKLSAHDGQKDAKVPYDFQISLIFDASDCISMFTQKILTSTPLQFADHRVFAI